MKTKTLFLSLFALLLLAACTPDPVDPVTPDNPNQLTLGKGVLVLNEGSYTNANSTLSFYDTEKDSVMNYLFYRVNGAPIGDVGQSLCLVDGKLFIVVNNSKYIYKVDARTIQCDTTQPYKLDSVFLSPRYMHAVAPNKAYVSDLISRNLWIIDPQTLTLSGAVAMGKPTETMVQVGRELFLTNYSRYYADDIQNNTVQVVDVENDLKVAEIEVGYEPNGMVVDGQGMVWVLCEGDVNDFDVPSTLWRIDPRLRRASLMRTFEEKALSLAIDPTGNYLYYFHNGDLHRCSVDAPEADDSFCIPADGRLLYKISVNPQNGDLYVSDAKNYVVNGSVYRYTSDGLLLGSFNAGICPGYMLFY